MECKTARNLLAFDHPTMVELDADDRAALEAHLAHCPDCDALARAERQFDRHLGLAIREVPVPTGLKTRLLEQLARDRDAWYRRWLARGMRVAAVAAVLLFGLYLGWNWHQQHLPRLDPESVAQEALQPRIAPPDRAAVEAWYHKKGIRTITPDRFNYAFLASYGLGEFQKEEVPHLFFQKGVNHAEVYILSNTQFDLHELPPVYHSPSGDQIQLQIWQPGNGYAYIILYTGDLLQLLQRDERPAA